MVLGLVIVIAFPDVLKEIPLPALKVTSSIVLSVPAKRIFALLTSTATAVKSYVVLVLLFETVLVNVILSPDLAILRPVPASKTISSVEVDESVNLIFSSSALSPSTQEIA